MTTHALSAADFPDGVEWFAIGEDIECQCPRCGSSVAHEEVDTIDFGRVRWRQCLSSAEWCVAHPLPGRENVPGAGRTLRVGEDPR